MKRWTGSIKLFKSRNSRNSTRKTGAHMVNLRIKNKEWKPSHWSHLEVTGDFLNDDYLSFLFRWLWKQDLTRSTYKVLLFCDYGTCSSFVPPSGTCWRHIQTIFLCSLLQKRNFQMGKLICCWVWPTLPQVTVLIEIKPRELKLHFFKSSWSHFKCSVTTGSQSCCSVLRTFPSPWRSPSVKKKSAMHVLSAFHH